MLTVFFLIFEPSVAWQKIAEARRGVMFILVVQLLPLIAVVTAAEGWGLMHWGKWQPRFGKLKVFTETMAVHFEILQAGLFLLAVLLCAVILHFAIETFNRRRTFWQSFAVMAYGFSPLLLLHLINLGATVHPAVSWIVGVVLTIWVLYQAVPRVLTPDPVHAFGAYLSAAFILVLVSGLMRIFTAMYLLGEVNFQRSAFTRALGQWLGQ